LKRFLPVFIQENYRSGTLSGRLEACTVFMDISGFTKLTEKLMRKGPEGAEELSEALNQVFQPTVSLVYAHGGFIPYFAGDSFMAIFPNDDAPDKTVRKVFYAMRQTLARFEQEREINPLFVEHKIGIKIGLAKGDVEWGIVGNKLKSAYFRGEAVDRCSQGQLHAKSLQMVCDGTFLQLLPHGEAEATEVEEGFYQLEAVPQTTTLESLGGGSPQKTPILPVNRDVISAFLPEAVYTNISSGEFRNVVSVFLSFTGIETYDGLDKFAAVVIDQCVNFGGYFKEIDFGDKGGVLLCLFGAPISFENNVERALEFVAATREELANLEALTGARYRIGVASGTAFTGVIGSAERSQYAAVGARVNLGARLMTKAVWGEVLVDENVQRNRNFKFVYRGELAYKGFEKNIPTYALTGRSLVGRAAYTGAYVGRSTEVKQLSDFAVKLREGRFPGVAFIFGEAGIGKTRLSYEFRRALRDTMAVSWFNCQSDQILRKPFNPFIYFLKNYFEQSPDNTAKSNKDAFDENLSELTNDLAQSSHPEAEPVRREIVRTQSVLAALIGIQQQGSLWEMLDARGRYQNALGALANLFVAESILQPLVIELEDTHWYDEMSREFLAQFVRRAQAYPILFVATSRYEDDGNKAHVFRQNLLREINAPFIEIDLNFLQPEDLRAFAEKKLNGPLHPELFELMQRMTQGNPFYVEQMAEYFIEANLLDTTDGLLSLKDQDIQISDSVKQIMMARIDRLSGLVKETVKAAAVIGREFELPVLSEVMSRQEEFVERNGDIDVVLREQVQTAEKWQIWHAMNELRYIFRHSLLREAAYDMQLRTRLRELHQSIAEAIEKLYPNSKERYVDLAFHYEEAEMLEQTNKYLEKAARYAQRNYQNRQALSFFEKLLHNLRDSGKKNKKVIRFHYRKGAIHELIGQWDEAEAEYKAGLNRSRTLNDWLLIGRGNRRIGQLLILRGNYPEAKRHLDAAITCYELANDQVGIAKTFGNLGTFFFRQGSYEAAKSWFAKAIEINRSVQRDAENAPIVANLGLIFMNQGHYDEGVRWLEEQLNISEHAQDKPGLATLYTNLGIIYLEKGGLDSALLCLEKGLTLSEELGNKLLMTICIGCIGSVWEKKGDYDKAMFNFERDLALCLELGDKQGTAIAYGLIGDLQSVIGNFDYSNDCLERALDLSRELGYKKGIAKALNTLGDNWFYLGDTGKSVKYYTEAIEVSRDMGNRLVLGYSLLEKGVVHIHNKEISIARQHLEEGRDIALALGNAELTFGANILRAQVSIAEDNRPEALRQLHQLLHMARSEREEASIHYELRKIVDNPALHREKARKLYDSLYNRTPQYLFKVRLAELEREMALEN
jgi:predicted ATPase/class 3 adenylate cyclase